jgi:hypothetical protein
MVITPPIRGLLAGAACTTLLAACSPGDVALEGKIFETIGAATGVGQSEREAKVAARPGLVVPPRLDSLPTPGEQSVPDGAVANIQDHDRKKVVDRSKLEAAQREYCYQNYELPKQRGARDVEDVQGPMGSCRPSIFNALAKWNKGE